MARGTTSGRVAKRTAPATASSSSGTGTRMSARQRSKLAEQVSSNSNSKNGGSILQHMVDEATSLLDDGLGSSASSGLTQVMEAVQYTDHATTTTMGEAGDVTSMRKEEKTFPLMQLPAEIRNEIYRACLTRPFNILLSKREPVAAHVPKEEETIKLETDDEGVTEELVRVAGDDEGREVFESTGLYVQDAVTGASMNYLNAPQIVTEDQSASSSAASRAGSSYQFMQTSGPIRPGAGRTTRSYRLLTARPSSSSSSGSASDTPTPDNGNNNGTLYRVGVKK